MKIIIILNALFTCLVLNSCQISGLTSGYNHLSREERGKIVNYKGKIDSISDYSLVYTITAEQVKDYILTHQRVIVYNYTPFCKSSFCISPTTLVGFYKAKGINVLVISNLYDDIFKGIGKDFPMLMINTINYNTKWRGKYTDAFYFSLIGFTHKEIDYAIYHYFFNGAYIKSFQNSADIEEYLCK